MDAPSDRPHTELETHLMEALESRTVIGEAVGIMMERYGLDADTALGALKRVSQQRNVKVRDLAAELVATGRVDGLT